MSNQFAISLSDRDFERNQYTSFDRMGREQKLSERTLIQTEGQHFFNVKKPDISGLPNDQEWAQFIQFQSEIEKRKKAKNPLEEALGIAQRLTEEQNPLERQRLAVEIAEQEAIFAKTHINTAEMKPQLVEKKALAFDLNFELEAIERYREQGRDPQEYWSFFKDQVEFYANEAHGKVERICYETQIIEGIQGERRLYIDAMGMTARQSYIQPVARMLGKDWEQERAAREYKGIVELEQLMNEHEEGTIFFDESPAPFEVSAQEKKDTMYGNHSFLRLNQVVNRVQDDGGEKKVLVSRAIRHYLTQEQQTKMFEILSGEKIASTDLLGTFALLKPEHGIIDVENDQEMVALNRLIKLLDQETAPEDRLTPPEDDQYAATAEQMKTYFADQEWWLSEIFTDLKDGPIFTESEPEWKKRIAKQFQAYENAIKSRVKGEWTVEEVKAFQQSRYTKHHQEDSMKGYDARYEDPRARFQRMEYKASTSSCGTGAGFGGAEGGLLGSTYAINDGLKGYEGMSMNSFKSGKKEKYIFNKKGKCRKCNKKSEKVGKLGPCLVCRGCQSKFDSGEY